ncbi:MAG: rRNA maturation RNase YbeY, partial [Alphaproteobacteria bacterium]
MAARRRPEAAVTGVAEVFVSVPCRRWLGRLPGAGALCRKAASAAFDIGAGGAHTGRGAFEVSLVLGDDDFVRALNRTYRGRDAATNVLAFGNFTAAAAMTGDGEKPVLLGDVVIAYETAVAEASAQGKSIEAHL